MDLKINMKRAGFTLAEVLITIGIIGIVAEVTIPVLKNNFQKTTTLSQLKKAYGMIENMYSKAVAENGAIDSWGLTGWGNTTGMEAIYQNILSQNLRFSKYCGSTGWQGSKPECWAYGCDIDGVSHCAGYPDSYSVYAVLADGTSIVFTDHSTPASNTYSIYFYVDLNGFKSPNRLGKDRFVFYVNNLYYTNSTIQPYMVDLVYPADNPDREDCWSNTHGTASWFYPGTGMTCAYTIIKKDNWQIADDYPF